jgi:hypothetical protein
MGSSVSIEPVAEGDTATAQAMVRTILATAVGP